MIKRIKKLSPLAFLVLTACVHMPPPLTTEQYCGERLGLKYGTHDYAQCGIAYSQLLINQQNARSRRIAAYQSNQPTDIYLHRGYP